MKDGYEHTSVNIEIGDDVIHCGIINGPDIPYKVILEREFVNKADKVFSKKY